MGAGDDPAGDSPAGHDAVADPGPAAQRRATGAILYDGARRDYVLDANGQYKTLHWVDQKVALALVIEERDVSAVPTLGSRLRSLTRGSRLKLQTGAEDAVRLALSQMIDAREIELVRVDVQMPARGKLLVTVFYVNLLLRDEKPREVQLRA
jgi:hypothetical protein